MGIDGRNKKAGGKKESTKVAIIHMRLSGLMTMLISLFLSTSSRFTLRRSYHVVSGAAAATSSSSSFIPPSSARRSSFHFQRPSSNAPVAAAAAVTLLLCAASSSEANPSSISGSGSGLGIPKTFCESSSRDHDHLDTTTATNSKDDVPVLTFPENVLQLDHYNGVSIHAKNLTNLHNFEPTLTQSLQNWTHEGKRGIWIYIPTNCSQIIPICTKLGFEFHSAKPGMLVLTRWLPKSTESRLPNGPTHQVGVGAVVLSPCGTKILVVQEQSGPASRYQLWKLPTGLCDPGEDIAIAATRELKEETGLDSTFAKILTFRQAHPGDRGSDLFFVCLMTLNDYNQKIKLQEEEIKDYKWMKIEDFCQQDLWQKSPVYGRLNEAMVEGIKTAGAGLEELSLPVGFREGSHSIYIPSKM